MFPDDTTKMIGHAGKNLICAGKLATFPAVSRGSAQIPRGALERFSIRPLGRGGLTKIDKIDAGRNIFLLLAGNNSQGALLARFRIIRGGRPCFHAAQGSTMCPTRQRRGNQPGAWDSVPGFVNAEAASAESAIHFRQSSIESRFQR